MQGVLENLISLEKNSQSSGNKKGKKEDRCMNGMNENNFNLEDLLKRTTINDRALNSVDWKTNGFILLGTMVAVYFSGNFLVLAIGLGCLFYNAVFANPKTALREIDEIRSSQSAWKKYTGLSKDTLKSIEPKLKKSLVQIDSENKLAFDRVQEELSSKKFYSPVFDQDSFNPIKDGWEKHEHQEGIENRSIIEVENQSDTNSYSIQFPVSIYQENENPELEWTYKSNPKTVHKEEQEQEGKEEKIDWNQDFANSGFNSDSQNQDDLQYEIDDFDGVIADSDSIANNNNQLIAIESESVKTQAEEEVIPLYGGDWAAESNFVGQTDLARLMCDRLVSRVVCGAPRTGKGLLIYRGLQYLKELRPDVELWALDIKADPGENGYYRLFDQSRLLRINLMGFAAPPDAGAKIARFFNSFDQSKAVTRLLWINELVTLAAKLDTKIWKDIQQYAIGICSAGARGNEGQTGRFLWLDTLSPNTSDIGLRTNAARNVFRRIFVMNQDSSLLSPAISSGFVQEPAPNQLNDLFATGSKVVAYDSLIDRWVALPVVEPPVAIEPSSGLSTNFPKISAHETLSSPAPNSDSKSGNDITFRDRLSLIGDSVLFQLDANTAPDFYRLSEAQLERYKDLSVRQKQVVNLALKERAGITASDIKRRIRKFRSNNTEEIRHFLQELTNLGFGQLKGIGEKTTFVI